MGADFAQNCGQLLADIAGNDFVFNAIMTAVRGI